MTSDFDTIREALQSAPEYVTPGGLKHCPARDALARIEAAAETAEADNRALDMPQLINDIVETAESLASPDTEEGT